MFTLPNTIRTLHRIFKLSLPYNTNLSTPYWLHCFTPMDLHHYLPLTYLNTTITIPKPLKLPTLNLPLPQTSPHPTQHTQPPSVHVSPTNQFNNQPMQHALHYPLPYILYVFTSPHSTLYMDDNHLSTLHLSSTCSYPPASIPYHILWYFQL